MSSPGAQGRVPRRPASGRRKAKVSVTVDGDLWDEVRSLVETEDAVETASAAVEEGLWMWVANRRLRRALDATYEENPNARPADDEVQRASEILGL
jgi:hypothetical protein